MYKNLVVLDSEKHKTLKISPINDLLYAQKTTHIPLLSAEISMLSSSFPVVFTSDENPSFVSLVSLGGDNLAINEEGKWISSYIPSHIRRYPFSFANQKDKPDQKVLMIDEDSALFSKSKGKQLFKKNGEKSESLQKSIELLKEHENQMAITQTIAKIIANSGILEEQEISVGQDDEKKTLVRGFKVVNREKLYALSDEVLADWVRKGIMSLIESHLKSLENVKTLFNLAHQRTLKESNGK